MKPVFLVDVFEEIVKKVSEKTIHCLRQYDNNITGVHYDHGHPREIIETLMQKDAANIFVYDKYPLVALFQDFPERFSNVIGAPGEVTFHLIIASSTSNEFKAKTRYERNFKPILYPIYMELMKQIDFDKHFMTYGASTIQHTKIDRLYWGREGLYGNEGNIFNDYLDVIEIRDLKLKTYLKFC